MDVMPKSTMIKNVMLISPNFGGGGAERSIAKLSMMLSDAGYYVHFVVFNVFPGREQVYPIKGTLHNLDVPAGQSFVDKGFRLFQRIIKVRKLKRELSIEACISFLEGADYVNILSGRNDKVIISIRGSKENDEEIKGLLGWIRKKFLMPWLYTRADHVVCVSEGIKHEIEDKLSVAPEKITVIHNSYDVNGIQTLAKEQLPSYAEQLFAKPCIITSGRLHPQKNHVGLIHSFARLKKLENNCKLVILGTGELKSQLIKTCSELGLSVGGLNNHEFDSYADVFFLGYQKNPWMFMRRARVFVLSSLWEGFPNALAEAMCLGLPVISTNCPHGPGEMLSEEPLDKIESEAVTITRFGALVPILREEKDYFMCAEVMKHFLVNDKLCADVGREAEIRIRSFSDEGFAIEWQSIIERPRV